MCDSSILIGSGSIEASPCLKQMIHLSLFDINQYGLPYILNIIAFVCGQATFNTNLTFMFVLTIYIDSYICTVLLKAFISTITLGFAMFFISQPEL